MYNKLKTIALGFSLLAVPASVDAQQASSKPSDTPSQPRTLARLFWQDAKEGTIRWGNVQRGQQWQLKAESIAGFPKLDTEESELVQMQQIDGVLVTGVRDHSDGQTNSGWIAIDCAVDKEEHGDHFHWRYERAPSVKKTQLGTDQGNPAHLYVYNNRFYMANDAKKRIHDGRPNSVAARQAGGSLLCRWRGTYHDGSRG